MTAMKPLLQTCSMLRQGWAWAVLVGLLALATPSRSMAAVDIYMKFEGVEGEATEARFVGWSKLVDVTNGVQAPASADPGNPPAAALTLQISKRIDKGSPLLAKACGDGSVTPRVTFVWAEGGSVFFKVILENVLVSSFTCSAEPDSPPLESLSFTYQKIEWSCLTDLGPDGGLAAKFDSATQAGALRVRPLFRAELLRRAGQLGLHLTCPVEAGHRYRISGNNSLSGPWLTIQEFTATDDGIADQFLLEGVGSFFLRVEALD